MAAATSAATTEATKKQRNKKQQLQPKKPIHKTKAKDQKKKKSSSNKVRNSDKVNLMGAKSAKSVAGSGNSDAVQWANASQQLNYFVNQYQSTNGAQLSSLELESLKETCFIECQDKARQSQTASGLSEHVKTAFGSSWKKVLCEKDIVEGSIEPGNPALLVISSSALRSLELLKDFRSLTKECHAAKLFSKHMKIEEQVSILKIVLILLVERPAAKISGNCIKAIFINHCLKANYASASTARYPVIRSQRRSNVMKTICITAMALGILVPRLCFLCRGEQHFFKLLKLL